MNFCLASYKFHIVFDPNKVTVLCIPHSAMIHVMHTLNGYVRLPSPHLWLPVLRGPGAHRGFNKPYAPMLIYVPTYTHNHGNHVCDSAHQCVCGNTPQLYMAFTTYSNCIYFLRKFPFHCLYVFSWMRRDKGSKVKCLSLPKRKLQVRLKKRLFLIAVACYL